MNFNKENLNCCSVLKNYKILFFVSLVAVIGGIVYVALIQRKHYFSHISKTYSLIDPTRNFLHQEDFIVDIQDLRENLNALVYESGDADSISIYFEVLNTGANISINSHKKIFPASLTKLPLAIAATKKVENNVWSWDTILVIEESDLDQNSGYLYQRGPGTKVTVDELLKELLVNSDNTAYRVLLRNIETQNLVNMVSSLGLEDLFTSDGRMSAKEYTRFFRALYSSSYLKKENSQKILDCLAKSKFNEYLASGLPKNILFSHKIGENYQYNSYSDSGIVYVKNRPYIITVMYETDNGKQDQEKVKRFMKQVSELSYQYISSK